MKRESEEKLILAALVPVTSDGGDEKRLKSSLQELGRNLCEGKLGNVVVHTYVGIDIGDPILDRGEDKQNMASKWLEEGGCFVRRSLRLPVGIGLCRIWSTLARSAYEDGCFYIVLLGDDITFDSSIVKGWAFKIHEAFQKLSIRLKSPLGFGCVALNEIKSPGFPSFPVLSKIHMDIFKGSIFPDTFVSQDADPYLFAIYRRWNGSVFEHGIRICNSVGGVELSDMEYVPPRYKRNHISWKDELLNKGVTQVQNWLKENRYDIERVIVIDVVTPSYRAKPSFLRGIIQQKEPKQASVYYTIIVDNPDLDIEWLRELEKEEVYIGKVRTRRNPVNLGASRSRNVGLKESSADWIVFLDDDIIPRPGLLNAYVEAIIKWGNDFDGFVGLTILPDENRLFPTAVHLSDVSYFWTIANKMKQSPWAVTANMACRRVSGLLFDPIFIKTGGGEDIDFCLQLPRQGMLCVPGAIVDHPWWRNGSRMYRHFFNWALGDSHLMDKYPHYTYRNWPNVLETLLLLLGISILLKLSPYRVIVALFCVLLSDGIIDVYRNCLQQDRHHVQPHMRGVWRIFTSLESCIIKNSSELGHLVAPWIRRRPDHFFRRFDWFCGQLPFVISSERRRAGIRFVMFLIIFVCFTIL